MAEQPHQEAQPLPVNVQQSNASDSELFMQYVDTKDVNAFNMLYERNRPRLYGYLFALCEGNHDRTDTIFQNSLTALLEHAQNLVTRIKNEQFNLRSYLFRIARNACIDELKKRNRNIPLDDLPETDGRLISDYKNPEEQHLDQEYAVLLKDAVRNAIRQLNPQQQEALYLREFSDPRLSHAQIGQILDVSKDRAYDLTRQARRRLQNILKKFHEDHRPQ